MDFLLRFLVFLILTFLAVVVIFAAYKNWRWVYRIFMSREKLQKKGERFAQLILYGIGYSVFYIGLMLLLFA